MKSFWGWSSSHYRVSVLFWSDLVWFASAVAAFMQFCFCCAMFLSSAASVFIIWVHGVRLHLFRVVMPSFSVLIATNLFGPLCRFCFWALVRMMDDLAIGGGLLAADFVLYNFFLFSMQFPLRLMVLIFSVMDMWLLRRFVMLVFNYLSIFKVKVEIRLRKFVSLGVQMQPTNNCEFFLFVCQFSTVVLKLWCWCRSYNAWYEMLCCHGIIIH